MKDFRQLPYRCVFEILIVLGHMARIIDVAGGSYNDTIKELTNDTYSTNDDSISPTNNQISSENEVLAGHKTVLYKQFYPCPEMCKCDRRQNKYSDGKLLYTADCSRAGLKQVPQVVYIFDTPNRPAFKRMCCKNDMLIQEQWCRLLWWSRFQ